MGVIAERIRVNIVDKGLAIAAPTLTKIAILGTTAGKAVRDRLMIYNSSTEAAGDFDAVDREFSMLQTIFAQAIHTAPPRNVYIWNVTRTDYRLATVDSGVIASQNALSFTADKFGDWGDRLSFQLMDGPTSGANGVGFTRKTLATGSVGGDTGITWTQTVTEATVVRIKLVDPQTPSKLFGIKVLDRDGLVPEDKYEYKTLQNVEDYVLEVTFATDSSENITTLASKVISALTNSGDADYNALAASLVDVADTGASDGTGTMTAVASTPIRMKTAISIKTKADGTSDCKAWELRDFTNQDTVLAPLYFVADKGSSNGTGTVVKTATNKEMELDITGATAGTFTLTYGGQTTATIAYNADIADLKTAIGDLSTVGTANVEVRWSGVAATPTLDQTKATVILVRALGGQDLLDITGTFAGLTGGTNTITETVAGVESWVDLDRISNQPASGLELIRALTACLEYSEDKKLEFPYWWCTTTREEVAGDGAELASFFSAQSEPPAQIILTNKDDETVLAQAQRRDSYVSDRVTFISHRLPDRNADAALAGVAAGQTQAFVGGSNEPWTLMYKTLNNVPSSNWNSTDRALLVALAPGSPGIITYEEDLGNVLVTGSWTTSGEFCDRRWKKDYITLHLRLAIFNLQKQGPPAYDNEGIGILKGVVRRKLQDFVTQRLIGAWDERREFGIFDLNFPKIHQVDEIDFNRRTYRCSARYQDAGVIEQVDLVLFSGFFANAGVGLPNIQ